VKAMTDRYRWMRRQTSPIPVDGASSPSEGPGTEREALFDTSLDGLVRAARAEGCPVNPEAAWRRIEAGLAAPAPGWWRLRGPLARVALAVGAAGCLLFFLGWHVAGGRNAPGATTHSVRLTPAIWRAEVIAADPLDGATDALINAVQEATP
jgi:hypothetical protein